MQVEVVDLLEIVREMLAHAVERMLINEAVVGHEADDTVSLA